MLIDTTYCGQGGVIYLISANRFFFPNHLRPKNILQKCQSQTFLKQDKSGVKLHIFMGLSRDAR